jgi:dynein assembly factor 2
MRPDTVIVLNRHLTICSPAAYIRQLEEQNELPDGKVLIRPKRGFVVKCFQKKNRDESKSKIFLNLVYSDEVSKPTSQPSSAGKNWAVPFALGHVRMELDNSNTLVPTFDCCFHTLALEYAHGSKAFCNLIVDIAKDAVQKSFEASGEETLILSGYKILKGVQYKTGSTPNAIMVSAEKQQHAPSNAIDKCINKKDAKVQDEAAAAAESCAAKKDSSPIVPPFKIVERGNFDIADHTTMTTKPISRKPKDVIVHISLEINSITDIDLDVSERTLALNSVNDAATKYHLEVRLPYRVNSKHGSAKYDKEQSKLIVTLPLIEE